MFARIFLLLTIAFGKILCDVDHLQLTDEEYWQMPDLFSSENYEKCLSGRDNAFCAGTFQLSGHGPSELYNILHKFSENDVTNFNHTRIHRALCVGPKTKCPLWNNLTDSVQRCVDADMMKEYGLRAQLREMYFCRKSGKESTPDAAYKAFVFYFTLVVLINIIGTGYHVYVKKENERGWYPAASIPYITLALFPRCTAMLSRWAKKAPALGSPMLTRWMDKSFTNFFVSDDHGPSVSTMQPQQTRRNSWLMAFSLIDNWKRMTAPSIADDPRLRNFDCFNGIKVITIFLVEMSHVAMLILLSFPANPKAYEESVNHPDKVTFINSETVVQWFFIASHFLIGYKMLLYSEKNKLWFSMLPKLLIDRMVRVYPMQLTAVAITATVLIHLGDGPLWYKITHWQQQACRQDWWLQLLFIQNFSPPNCLPQSWYLAADMQLYLFSCLLMIWIISRGLNPEYVLKWVIAISMAATFVIVYTFEFKPAIFYNKPENLLNMYANEKSYLFYQSFWGNLPGALMGLLFASIYYRLEKQNVDLSKNKAFVWLTTTMDVMIFAWNILPYFFILTMKSRFAVTLFATINKPTFSLISALMLMGCFYNIKGPLKSLFNWSGWLVFSRMSLGALMLHPVTNMLTTATRVYPSTMSVMQTFVDSMAVMAFTYVIVVPLMLLIEYPAVQVYKILTNSRSASQNQTKRNENNGVAQHIASNNKQKHY